MARRAALREIGMANFFGDDDDTSSDNNEDYEDIQPRRSYTLRSYAVVDDWDDVAFHQRFRIKKKTFCRVVDLIEPYFGTAPRR